MRRTRNKPGVVVLRAKTFLDGEWYSTDGRFHVRCDEGADAENSGEPSVPQTNLTNQCVALYDYAVEKPTTLVVLYNNHATEKNTNEVALYRYATESPRKNVAAATTPS